MKPYGFQKVVKGGGGKLKHKIVYNLKKKRLEVNILNGNRLVLLNLSADPADPKEKRRNFFDFQLEPQNIKEPTGKM